MPAVTKTVTVTSTPPPPPPGPKTTIESNGTFIVGADIAPGTYRSAGKYGCYWARLRSPDTGDVVEVINTVGPTLPGTEGLGDWNVPWAQWKAGNANT